MEVIRGQSRFWEVVQEFLPSQKVGIMSVLEVWRPSVVAQ